MPTIVIYRTNGTKDSRHTKVERHIVSPLHVFWNPEQSITYNIIVYLHFICLFITEWFWKSLLIFHLYYYPMLAINTYLVSSISNWCSVYNKYKFRRYFVGGLAIKEKKYRHHVNVIHHLPCCYHGIEFDDDLVSAPRWKKEEKKRKKNFVWIVIRPVIQYLVEKVVLFDLKQFWTSLPFE